MTISEMRDMCDEWIAKGKGDTEVRMFRHYGSEVASIDSTEMMKHVVRKAIDGNDMWCPVRAEKIEDAEWLWLMDR